MGHSCSFEPKKTYFVSYNYDNRIKHKTVPLSLTLLLLLLLLLLSSDNILRKLAMSLAFLVFPLFLPYQLEPFGSSPIFSASPSKTLTPTTSPS
ncbi:hypothetical protein CARUB_v10024895mg [Capsella rubella]|uniref:Uncharacterized protein n=1 Tax=Capsella rubella TaxID=81985 RepID=R0G0I8_9BRAS|nr:hypothetical protein CARUB_v10024895mg [Capsella rubella]